MFSELRQILIVQLYERWASIMLGCRAVFRLPVHVLVHVRHLLPKAVLEAEPEQLRQMAVYSMLYSLYDHY